mmetsp:Transcript_17334/g.15251  ORF Transcript_17334/g.15251 Transcript_17334/m.15251 type:complete len:109 (+) Transcript_17334:1357-1683(+)
MIHGMRRPQEDLDEGTESEMVTSTVGRNVNSRFMLNKRESSERASVDVLDSDRTLKTDSNARLINIQDENTEKKGLIILVDDNTFNLLVAQNFLVRQNFRVRTAMNGQ